MNKSILPLCLLTLLAVPAMAQEVDPIYYRRTLSVPFGQTHLEFEAPLRMCFLDESKFMEGASIKLLRDIMKKANKEILMTSFMDCMGLAAANAGAPLTSDFDETKGGGSVTWLNPYIGEKTELSRPDYLDMREAGYLDYLKKDFDFYVAELEKLYRKSGEGSGKKVPVYALDKAVHRGDNGVMVGYTINLDEDGAKKTRVGVAAATVIREFPVEISIDFETDKPEEKMPEVYALMEKFLAQQIALNEGP